MYIGVLACFAIGAVLGLHSAGDVRWGSALAGGAMVLAGLARLVLPERAAGMLVCRVRYLDAATLAVLGLGVAIVGLVLPPPT